MAAAIRPGFSAKSAKRNTRRKGGASFRSDGRSSLRMVGWMFGLGALACFVLALSLALVVGFRWLTTSSYFSLREVQVTGNARLTVDEIIGMTGIELGHNTLDIAIADVEERVASNPWAERVAVRRVLPGAIAIDVAERQPSFWVRNAQGVFYAESDGDLIAPVTADRLASLPVLDVEPGAQEQLGGVASRLEAFDACGLPLGWAQAAWVRVSSTQTEIFFEDRDLVVAVANEPWEANMKLLQAVWRDLERRSEAGTVREISIFGGKVWVGA